MNQRDQFMAVLFNPGEQVCSGHMYSVEVTDQHKVIGPYISINPLTNRRLDSNVTSFRNFLIEMDQPGLSQAEQLERAVNLPYSTATWSGSKSVHFIVALEEGIEPGLWRRWAAALIKSMPGADASTKNPSRFSRLPNHFRADTQQLQELLVRRGRVSATTVAQYVEPFLQVETTDYRTAYNNFKGLTGLAACHPMTRAFIAGTHPCPSGRNNALFKSAKDLKDCTLEADEIHHLLTPPALDMGLELREINQTIRSALNK